LQSSSSPWNVNPSAFGQEFLIHDPQVENCGVPNNSFKGLNGYHLNPAG
jgi:hypothetical protein